MGPAEVHYMTLRSVDCVNIGEQCRLLTGGILNGPIMALFEISCWRYFEMHAGCCVAVLWLVTTKLGSNSGEWRLRNI